MDQRALGVIEGELRQIGNRLSELQKDQRELREENARDHEAVVQGMARMGEGFKKELDKTADQADLEDVRDEGREGVSQIRGWFFTLFGLIVGAGLVNVILAHGI